MARKPDKRIFLSAPHMSGAELVLVTEAFESNYVAPAGPMIARFEKAFCDYTAIPYAVAMTSGTAALHVALRLAGVAAGHEVWCSTLTFVGNVAPAVYLGARPVFFDVDDATYNIDVDLLGEALERANGANSLPAAIVPTDLFGQCADMDPILDLAERYGVPVIFDSAESLGARYKDRHAGDGGLAAIFSFNGNKIITSSGGGMLVTHDRGLADQARHLSQQARDPAPHYEHSVIGYNYRMSNIVAAIGLAQLQVVKDRVARRRQIFARYRESLSDIAGLSFMPEADYGRATRWLTVIQIDPSVAGVSSEALRVELEEHNIESRPVWKPMHLQPVFQAEKAVGGAVSERLFAEGLCLPSGSGMTDDSQDFVCERIRAALRADRRQL